MGGRERSAGAAGAAPAEPAPVNLAAVMRRHSELHVAIGHTVAVAVIARAARASAADVPDLVEEVLRLRAKLVQLRAASTHGEGI